MPNPEKMQLDFSKPGDQEKFFNLPKELQESIIEKAHDDADTIKKIVSSGEAKNYSEALKMIEGLDLNEYAFRITIAKNGDISLDLGGGSSLIGNAHEGVFSEADGMFEADVTRLDQNILKIMEQIDLLVGKPQGNA